MSNVEVKALRQIYHEGQKWAGDTFEMPKVDAERLAETGAVELVKPKAAAKAEPATKNKAEQAAPANKADD